MPPSSPNPYVTAAMADTATAQIITELSELLADETNHNNASHANGYQAATEQPQSTGGYVSAVDAPAPKPSTIASGYVSATTPESAHPDIGYPAIAPTTQAVETSSSQSGYLSPADTSRASQPPDRPPTAPSISASSSYLSPKESWDLEKQQQQQSQIKAQQQARQRYQQEQQAKRFLAKLSKLDPLEGTRMWFEDFAKLCPSRLEAAIEFLATVPTKPS